MHTEAVVLRGSTKLVQMPKPSSDGDCSMYFNGSRTLLPKQALLYRGLRQSLLDRLF